MTQFPYWIQRADFSAQDLRAVDVSRAVRAFEEVDWERELAARRSREAAGEEPCDPGMGFVPGDGRILHICPLEAGRAYAHYHYMEKSKVLGLFTISTPKNRMVPGFERAAVPEYITRFFDDDHEWLLARTEP